MFVLGLALLGWTFMLLAASSLQRNVVTLRHGLYERGCYGCLRRRGGSRGWWGSLLGLGRRREFMVLALESSADDTCAAVVTSDKKILSNVVISQSARLEEYGGISPYVAILEHQRKMPIAVRRALDEAKRNLNLNLNLGNNNSNIKGRNDELDILSRIDGIAYTRGPGMAGCLSVCANAAKALAAALNKPIIGVHHMQAHALTPLLTSSPSPSPYSLPSSSFPSPPSSLALNTEPPTFPFLTLLISGGHTLLLLALSHTKFKILATTVDEAIGRCIDKVARELGIGWKGRAPGAALEAFCRDGVEMEGVQGVQGVRGVNGVEGDGVGDSDVKMKIPFRGELKFSFSGLHSAVDRYILQHGTPAQVSRPSEIAQPTTGTGMEIRNVDKTQSHPSRLLLSDPHKLTIARAFQNAAFKQLEEKVVLGLKWCAKKGLPVKHVVVSGGVASNIYFRQRLQACLTESFPDEKLSLVFPPPSLCTDNAAMIAWASMHRFLAGESDDYSIDSRAKWSIEELDVS